MSENYRYKKDDLNDDDDLELLNIKEITFWFNRSGLNSTTHNVKPILRPLSDLTKGDLDYLLNHHSTDWFVDTDFENMIIKYLEHKNLHNLIEFLPFGLVRWFIENHYDIFGLIDHGLAIDINTI